jgi:hypothetical protein
MKGVVFLKGMLSQTSSPQPHLLLWVTPVESLHHPNILRPSPAYLLGWRIHTFLSITQPHHFDTDTWRTLCPFQSHKFRRKACCLTLAPNYYWEATPKTHIDSTMSSILSSPRVFKTSFHGLGALGSQDRRKLYCITHAPRFCSSGQSRLS